MFWRFFFFFFYHQEAGCGVDGIGGLFFVIVRGKWWGEMFFFSFFICLSFDSSDRGKDSGFFFYLFVGM